MNLFNRRQSLTLLGAAVLVPSVTPTWAQATTSSPTTSTTAWPDTLRAARGQTVYFNAWAGSERINAYLQWAAAELQRDFGVKLQHVKQLNLLDYQIKNPEAIPWELVELPAILNEGEETEKSLWPEQWSLELLKSTKASIDPRYWNAQYMQQPTAESSAVISRKHWRIWEKDDPPSCDYVIQSWDTAFETKTTSDYSACTTWGVFYNEEEGNSPQIILLDAFKDRMAYPELKTVALRHYKEWTPDAFIVEKKAAGAPLIQELRQMGIPVSEFSPSRGNDKMVRVNAVADLFTSGKVWAPDTRWAREVIEEVAAFPVGENDDYVDTTTQALLRYRQGGFIPLDTDEQEDKLFRQRRAAYY